MNHASFPNIILILADDLGYGDLSCMNPASGIQTRNLDRLATPPLPCAPLPGMACSPDGTTGAPG